MEVGHTRFILSFQDEPLGKGQQGDGEGAGEEEREGSGAFGAFIYRDEESRGSCLVAVESDARFTPPRVLRYNPKGPPVGKLGT